MQRQGINPFLELDVDNLPSTGTNYEDVFGVNKVYGNIIDGLPGYQIYQGTGRYEPIQDQMEADATTLSYIRTNSRETNEKFNAWYTDCEQDANGFHDITYDIETTNHTLGGGVLANAPVYASAASVKVAASWIALSWDTDPAAAYVLQFHEADSATVLWELRWLPAEIGERKMLMVDTATANKNLLADISGGAGAEALITKCNGGQW